MKPEAFSQVKGFVFDKDGTLFDFNSVWSVWCDRVLQDLSDGNSKLAESLAKKIGYDIHNGVFTPGSLIVSAAAEDIARAFADNLPEKSVEEVNTVCVKHLGNLPLSPVKELASLLNALHAAGFKLGVATNDLESAAVSQLTEVEIDHYFDFVCGCDSGHGSKPAPGMIHAFCDATNLAPSQVAMVGDSLHDINAGLNACVAMNIGVLTGPATEQDLADSADIVLRDISEIKSWL